MKSHEPVEKVVQLYGDLLFDLCESVLWSAKQAPNAFRTILKEIRKSGPGYEEHERAWILKIAFEKLKELSIHHARKVTASEQIQLDATSNVSVRLKQFDIYFHKLTTEEQVVLLLRDKYGLPYGEVASVTGLPEGSVKSIRQQALRALESWLWEDEQ